MKFVVLMSVLISLASCAQLSDKKNHKPHFSKLGKGDITKYAGRNVHHHIHTDDLPSKISLIEEVLPPKSLGAPPHKHADEDEIFVVLSGKVHFLNGKEEVVATKGTIASLPRGHFHGFWNPYNVPSKLLLVVAPGHFENFFKSVQNAVKNKNAKTPQQIGMIISEEAKKRNVEIDMSKLPESGRKLLGPPPRK